MIAYLVHDDLFVLYLSLVSVYDLIVYISSPSAQVTLNRLHPQLSNHPLVRALRALHASLTARSHAAVFARASDLTNVELYPSPEVADLCSKLLNELTSKFRERTFRLIGRAFDAIEVKRAEVMLGLKDEVIVPEALRRGWVFEKDLGILRPAQDDMVGVRNKGVSGSLSSFQGLVHSVVGLEV